MTPERFGPYLLLEKLGAGGMGDAHLAQAAEPDSKLPRLFVIKRLHSELGLNERNVQRFRHEGRIATLIQSPYLPKVYAAGQVGQTLFIAMEMIHGWPLSRVIREYAESQRPISLSSALDLCIDTLRGLRDLHEAKDADGAPLTTLHRDISPKNLMLGSDGRVRVIDLGLGKSKIQDWHTRTGAVMGTPGYMAPEQVRGEAVDPRTDLYAVGLVLFELLALEPYIAPGPLPIVLRASLEPIFRSPSSIRAPLPPALDSILAQALAQDPERRFPSATAMIAALEGLRGDAPRVPARTLIGELAFGELTEEALKAERLLASSASAPDTISDQPGLEPTRIFASRTEQVLEDVSPTRPLIARPTAPAGAPRAPRPGISLGAAVAAAVLAGIGGLWLGPRIRPTTNAEAPERPAPAPGPVRAVVAVPSEALPEAPPPPPVAPSRPPSPSSRPSSTSPRPASPLLASPAAPSPDRASPPSPENTLARRPGEALGAWQARLVEHLSERRAEAYGPDREALSGALVRLSRLDAAADAAELEAELQRLSTHQR
ncbi:MAG: serine/threonine-protein kinase [Myxococcota bacterium]